MIIYLKCIMLSFDRSVHCETISTINLINTFIISYILSLRRSDLFSGVESDQLVWALSSTLHFKIIYLFRVLPNLYFQHGRHSSLFSPDTLGSCFLNHSLLSTATTISSIYPFCSVLRFSFIQQIFIKRLPNTLPCFSLFEHYQCVNAHGVYVGVEGDRQ